MPGTSLIQSVRRTADRIAAILDGNVHSIWLYGSVALEDFRPGWSDIDILALTGGPVTEHQAQQLAGLRQDMTEEEPDNPYYRLMEGIIADRNEYITGAFSRLVYWGTSGQRITDRYQPDAFSLYELAKYGICVCGAEDRSIFTEPSAAELREAVRHHYETIRRYAVQTDEKLYSCGWLLDIARCIHTLRYQDVIAKTEAGIRALTEHYFEDEESIRTAVEIRQNPPAYRDREDVRQWLRGLGPVVQQYADVLERELYLADPCRASSLPFRKMKTVVIPKNITVLREDRYDAAKYVGTDEPYFKMIHSLQDTGHPALPASFETVRLSIEDYARHISECYAEEHVTADKLRAGTKEPDYDPDLWIAVADTTNGRIAASGIAEIDRGIREGTLEWIQVSPDYRHMGLGKYIVCELLRRLRDKADFVTVSGRMNNPDNPLALYGSCGFTDCVIWHVIRKET